MNTQTNLIPLHYYCEQQTDPVGLFHMLSSGVYEAPASSILEKPSTSCYALLYVYEGRIEMKNKHGVVYLETGQCSFFACDSHFSCRFRSVSNKIFFVSFSGASADMFYQLCHVDSIPNLSNTNILNTIERFASHKVEDTICDQLLYSKWLNDILTEYVLFHTDTNSSTQHIPQYIQDMKTEIDKNYQKSYSLEYFENLYHKSKYRLCREFTLYFGISPIQYINQTRISEAKKLLLSTDMMVHEVSTAVGIDNVNHFINLFKKNTGVTPLVFKQGTPASICELHCSYIQHDHL